MAPSLTQFPEPKIGYHIKFPLLLLSPPPSHHGLLNLAEDLGKKLLVGNFHQTRAIRKDGGKECQA